MKRRKDDADPAPAESGDDSDWFAEAMRDVVPLKTTERAPDDRPRARPVPRQREADEARVMQELLLDPETREGLETGEELQWLRPGYQRRYLRRLRRGQYAIRDHLDLHQMNEETARQAMLDFLEEAMREGHGCVRIVHGKGLRSKTRPKLKMLANRLLRRHPAVVAFTSCRPVDGGTGAVSVLMRPVGG